MTDVLADTETYGPVYAAIAHVWGERCSDYEPGCPCCDAWAEYDRLSNASAENERLRAALRGSYEVYAGSDGFIPATAAEGYQQQIIKQMVDCISAALEGK